MVPAAPTASHTPGRYPAGTDVVLFDSDTDQDAKIHYRSTNTGTPPDPDATDPIFTQTSPPFKTPITIKAVVIDGAGNVSRGDLRLHDWGEHDPRHADHWHRHGRRRLGHCELDGAANNGGSAITDTKFKCETLTPERTKLNQGRLAHPQRISPPA